MTNQLLKICCCSSESVCKWGISSGNMSDLRCCSWRFLKITLKCTHTCHTWCWLQIPSSFFGTATGNAPWFRVREPVDFTPDRLCATCATGRFQCFPRDTYSNKVVDNDLFIKACRKRRVANRPVKGSGFWGSKVFASELTINRNPNLYIHTYIDACNVTLPYSRLHYIHDIILIYFNI